MRQRLLIARAFAGDTTFFFFDFIILIRVEADPLDRPQFFVVISLLMAHSL